jgi:hypothetical protein
VSASSKLIHKGPTSMCFKGAVQTIARCRPTTVYELERDLAKVHGNELADYARFFQSLDYGHAVLDGHGEGKQTDYLARPN